MITLFRTDTIYKIDQIKEALAEQIKQLPNLVRPIGTPHMILRYEFPCESVDCLSWLNHQQTEQKLYWSDRHGEFEVAGVGEADCVRGDKVPSYPELFDYFQQRLSPDNPHLRYYGGLCFDHKKTNSDWDKMGSFYFAIPRFELFKTGSENFFAFNIAFKDICKENIQQICCELDYLNFNLLPSDEEIPDFGSRQNLPDQNQWNELFSQVQASLRQKDYEKIVLARKTLLKFSRKINPGILMKRLRERTKNCFLFCFQPTKGYAFLGASPERLYKRQARKAESEALAGTRPRGKNSEEDERLKNELLTSSKDAAEHQFVVDFLKRNFDDLCFSWESDQKSGLAKIKGGHHLVTRFKGDLKDNIADEHLLASLHPTPAVGGCPTDKAIEGIDSLESFDRGWYAGPVGFVGCDETEFAVAIRCGLVDDRNLSLYAGAGIIAESAPEDEWNEIENKIGSFIRILEDKGSQSHTSQVTCDV